MVLGILFRPCWRHGAILNASLCPPLPLACWLGRAVPFRQYNIPSKDFGKDAIGCVAAIENVAIESARGPTFICCNDANKTADGGAGLNVSLAAYLMNANDNSYFGPGAFRPDLGNHRNTQQRTPI